MSEDRYFTPDIRRWRENRGWELNYDLVGEVYVKQVYDGSRPDEWVVLMPDARAYFIKTDNISAALGTY